MTTPPSAEITARLLSLGSVAAAALFLGAFVLSVAGVADGSAVVAGVALVALLATPAAGLLATALELRHFQPRVAVLALLVLLIVAAAAALAFAGQ